MIFILLLAMWFFYWRIEVLISSYYSAFQMTLFYWTEMPSIWQWLWDFTFFDVVKLIFFTVMLILIYLYINQNYLITSTFMGYLLVLYGITVYMNSAIGSLLSIVIPIAFGVAFNYYLMTTGALIAVAQMAWQIMTNTDSWFAILFWLPIFVVTVGVLLALFKTVFWDGIIEKFFE